ncbi:hypothetical protein [Sphingobacterium pedocola]|uniref:Uncharacterized protein n=1 Tax=Sphingobacterium pedocola TaxID=2082722 RepID=A0ABR9T1D8_9SPHI|nr:hypothetical protein [Sphingobacterium pedocola]MBE8719161.1 hypothetical protein [Sphingobacterium pedocola]
MSIKKTILVQIGETMKVLALLLWTPILCILHSNAFSQVIVNKTESYISRLNKGTVYEMGAARLTDGDILFFYHTATEEKLDFAEILLSDQSDFDKLYDIILDGFNTKDERQVKVDLGDSFLYLYYTPMLFSSPYLHITHGYKSSPYVTKRSQQLSLKDVKKAFGKSPS